MLAITDSSGNAALSTPSTISGSWTLVQSGPYCALWIGKGLPATSYDIDVTCVSGTNQGAVATPIFAVQGTLSSTSVVTSTSVEVSPSPFSLSPLVPSMAIFVAGGVFTSAGLMNYFATAALNFSQPLVIVGYNGNYNGFVSIVPVQPGLIPLGVYSSPAPTFTAISALLT